MVGLLSVSPLSHEETMPFPQVKMSAVDLVRGQEVAVVTGHSEL